LTIFPTRESFTNAVLEAFRLTPATPLRWVCSRENHRDGNPHYHMAVKLDRVQRWLLVKERIHNMYGVVVNFSGHHHNYFSAWQYATKDDEQPLQSPDHPDLSDGVPPNSTNASLTRVGRRGKKRKRLSTFDLGEIVVRKKIRNRLQLLAYCDAQKKEGKTDLAEMVFNRGVKAIDYAIALAWEMEGAQVALDRLKMRRLDILREARGSECVAECNGEWLPQARDILNRNGIEERAFCNAVVSLLREGRGKFRNILITGPTNCGKSFILHPLAQIYQAFQNPANNSYAWLGAETAEVIILNDFRWTPQVIIKAVFLELI